MAVFELIDVAPTVVEMAPIGTHFLCLLSYSIAEWLVDEGQLMTTIRVLWTDDCVPIQDSCQTNRQYSYGFVHQRRVAM